MPPSGLQLKEADAATASVLRPLEAPEAILRRLEWKVIRRLDGRLQGDYRTLLHGGGIDVAELREYESGDDVRHIDWNVTARMDTPFVKTFHEDRALTAWLLLDRSASMSFGREGRSKDVLLADVGITLARVLSRGGNLVGAVVWGDGTVRTIPARTGRNQVLRLAHDLTRPRVPPASTSATRRRFRGRSKSTEQALGSVTDLSDLLTIGAQSIRRRSLVVVISDFISEPGWQKPLSQLAQQHEVVAIRTVDPRELELPDAGMLIAQDSETGETVTVDSSDPEFRQRFAESAVAREQAIRSTAAAVGVDLHTVSTEEDLVSALVRIVELRRRRRR